MSEDNETSLKEKNLMIWVIWAALAGSLFMYLFVLVYLGQTGEAPDDVNMDLVETMTYIFAGVSVLEVVILRFLRSTLFFRCYEAGEFESKQEVASAYHRMSIVTGSMALSVGIYGFVLSILTYELIYFAGFMVPSLALFIILRPRLLSVVEEYETRRH